MEISKTCNSSVANDKVVKSLGEKLSESYLTSNHDGLNFIGKYRDIRA